MIFAEGLQQLDIIIEDVWGSRHTDYLSFQSTSA
jgi:hypothetical protein